MRQCKKRIVRAIGAALGIAALAMFVRTTLAADHMDAPLIRLDHGARTFVLDFRAKFGVGVSGHMAGFMLCTVLEITDAAGNQVVIGPQCDPVQLADGRGFDSEGHVWLLPQRIPWDPTGASGEIVVLATTQLVNPGGVVTHTVEAMEFFDLSPR